ncbi:MAG: two-component system, OmpR family, phosphate regulon sensor histidine kinase PhoR [Kosmotogales bacterium]|nr:two-component system, OmpR family, phosphate regulon sensor histidine kinase PhoR [Kosmotogales bacterium]
MKIKNKALLLETIVLFLVFLPLCFGAAFLIYSIIFKSTAIFMNVFGFAAVSMTGILIFLIVFSTIWFLTYLHKKDRSHFKILREIKNVLTKISEGDFNVEIEVAPYRKNRYRSEMIIDLADKINIMARELKGMESIQDDFISSVSHEIQSPLTSICGFISLLKKENLDNTKRLRYIEIIEIEALRLSKLSDNLLKLSVLDSEYASLQPKEYLLNKQIKNVVLMMEPQWSAKHIEVSVDETPVYISADEDLLDQVWINLLQNSIKFTPEGGKINIDLTKNERFICFSIKDNGIGMINENIFHIFEKFYMADKSRNRSMGGNGLGLAIVKKIINMHNGKIEVDSKVGQGTIFKIILPNKFLT